MEKELKINIVVPCYNEGKRLPADEFSKFLKFNGKINFVFVNDGSTDNTIKIIEEIRDRFPKQVNVLDLPENQGKGEAVRKGIQLSLSYDADIVGFWDADLATPLPAIFEFIDVYHKYPQIKWIFGARVSLMGRHIKRKAIRHYFGRAFATATSIVLNLPVYDTQCGAKLFKVDNQLKEIIDTKFISRWIFDVELIARLIKLSSKSERAERVIYEFPLHDWTDIDSSKVKATDFAKSAVELYRIWRYLQG